jgi:retron-type reverse transcriptase
VAALLRYRPSAVSFIVHTTPPAARYTTFDIPKRSGGVRTIDAPNDRLKGLQRSLSKLLFECLCEIEAKDPRRNKLSHAFRPGASIISNAKTHHRRRYVLNLDLKDFFPAFNFGRVRGFFLKNEHFRLAEPVATLLAQIACKDGKLPQGSPCSPVITELMTHFLDIRLVKLAARHKCTYTRYADDITISTNQREFPSALAELDGTEWKLGEELVSRINDAGFEVNDAKTRMQLRGSRQIVTGLTVNEKVNVAQAYYKRVRATAHRFLTTGAYELDGAACNSVPRLEGMINHIYHVRERQIDIAIANEGNKEKQHKLHAERTKTKNEWPSAIRVVYYELIFFKNFINPPRPLIICEGPTDPVYLKSAIRRLAAAHPLLASVVGGKPELKVNFFKYSDQARDFLQLRGGSGDLLRFLISWKDAFNRYDFRPAEHPVIVLIDNDDGAKEIFSYLNNKKNYGLDIAWDKHDPFFHLHGPLYLVKTPALGANHKSCPEDFFEPAVLAEKLDGKSFNKENKINPATEYGKAVFATWVVRPKVGAINFAGFTPLLERIEAVIRDYAARKAAAAVPAAAPVPTAAAAAPAP